MSIGQREKWGMKINTYLEKWPCELVWVCVCVCWQIWRVCSFTQGFFFFFLRPLTAISVRQSTKCQSRARDEWKRVKIGGRKRQVKRMFFTIGVPGWLACQGGQVLRGDTHVITYALQKMIRVFTAHAWSIFKRAAKHYAIERWMNNKMELFMWGSSHLPSFHLKHAASYNRSVLPR